MCSPRRAASSAVCTVGACKREPTRKKTSGGLAERGPAAGLHGKRLLPAEPMTGLQKG